MLLSHVVMNLDFVAYIQTDKVEIDTKGGVVQDYESESQSWLLSHGYSDGFR